MNQQDSLQPSEREALNIVAELVHANAVGHGWWACQTCDGEGHCEHTQADGRVVIVTCPACAGSGQHRNVAESIALIHSELSEALEALRAPDLEAVCDKCVDGSVPHGSSYGKGKLACVTVWRPEFAELCAGDYVSVLALSQLCYWTTRCRDRDGWVQKTAEEFVAHFGLTISGSAMRRKLRRLVCESDPEGLPPTKWPGESERNEPCAEIVTQHIGTGHMGGPGTGGHR